MTKKPFALYLHIPYCLHKCPYCDFNTYAVKKIPEDRYCTSLINEFQARMQLPEWQDRPISSIYFGGGTPSVFSLGSFEKLFFAFSKYNLELKEFSLEANPGNTSLEMLKGLKNLGVNRISFGAQSLSEKNLRTLGRTHTPGDVYKAIEFSYLADISNINLDLMYGIPEQTLQELELDLNQYSSLNIQHISPYNLTIEPGTTYHQRVSAGSLVLPEEDIIVSMMRLVDEKLTTASFERYEISNYAKLGKRSWHNMNYWQLGDYLGLGAGAHSFYNMPKSPEEIYGRRWSNIADPNLYMNTTINKGLAEAWSEQLNLQSAIFEYLFLGLRQAEGILFSLINQRFDIDIKEYFNEQFKFLKEHNLINVTPHGLSLTERGILLSDSVFERFGANGKN